MGLLYTYQTLTQTKKMKKVELPKEDIKPIFPHRIDYQNGIVAYWAGGSGPAILTAQYEYCAKNKTFGFRYLMRGVYQTDQTLKFEETHPAKAVEKALKASREVFVFKDQKEFAQWMHDKAS